ncbi:hypothetical protein EDB89DRAFT_1975842 [Lactarius sanguifluus]|nr:hypothetical protein EDB89DRAFT_2030255 [Lactarius sanguifluus]KAH9170786.1 hypothetical protein EDB89DRAFT_1975842 [Lactarius sanguifluus]
MHAFSRLGPRPLVLYLISASLFPAPISFSPFTTVSPNHPDTRTLSPGFVTRAVCCRFPNAAAWLPHSSVCSSVSAGCDPAQAWAPNAAQYRRPALSRSSLHSLLPLFLAILGLVFAYLFHSPPPFLYPPVTKLTHTQHITYSGARPSRA